MVTFKEDTHQYFNDEKIEYLSGTRFLHKFEFPFDEDGISKRVALKEGVSQEEILRRWKETSKKACSYGTEIHALMENYIKFGEVNKAFESLYKSFDKITKQEFNSAKEILSEELLYDDEYRIAGTADLIIVHNDKEFSVGDFKTNKSIDFYSPFGNRMLDPISHLSSCNYNIYSLQLSLYARMFANRTGLKCRRVFLMHKVDDTWKYISANNMLYEIKMMLKYYQRHMMK